jgi:outer membrane protein assembly factor BamA
LQIDITCLQRHNRHQFLLFLYLTIVIQLVSAINFAIAQNASPIHKHQLNLDSNYTSIKSVDVSGNKKTKAAVILREIGFEKSKSLSKDSLSSYLKQCYTRLYNLNLFTEINVEYESIDSSSGKLIIKLKEQWFIIPQADVQLADRNINVWWNEKNRDFSRINLGIYLLHKNLTGNLDELKVSSHFGYTQQFNCSYKFPYLDAQQKHGLMFSGGYSQSKEIAYNTLENKLQFVHHNEAFISKYTFGSVGYIYRPAYHNRHLIQFGFHQLAIGDTVLQLNPDYFYTNQSKMKYLELSHRLEHNGVDNWNYPREGWKLVIGNALRKNIASNHLQLISQIETGYFKKIHNKLLGSVILRARNNFGNEHAYFLKSALGYQSNLVRGYEYYVVEGDRFAIGRFTLKYEALKKLKNNTNIPYLSNIPIWIYPKIFSDFGYVQNKNAAPTNSLANQLLYSFGVGLDIITAYDLKIRIEWSWNHMLEKGLYLHANSE